MRIISCLFLAVEILSVLSFAQIPTFPNTAISTSKTPPAVSVQNHWSQVVTFPRPDINALVAGNSLYSGCPHQESNLVLWESPSAWVGGTFPLPDGTPKEIAANTKVLIKSSSLRPGTYGIITIPATSALIFDDAKIFFNTLGIKVFGRLAIGSPTCRIRNNIKIILTGFKPAVVPADPWLKGIYVTGTLDIHSQVYAPTWTRLAVTAQKNDLIIFLQDLVNWEIGQSIIITTTIPKDSRDYTENEVRKIVAINTAPNLGPKISAITLNAPLNFTHFGGTEYQAEVGLLSRRISVEGNILDSNPPPSLVSCTGGIGQKSSSYPCPILNGYGGHIIVTGPGIGRVTGVQLRRMGQTNVLGRYPFHLHMIGEGGVNSYFRDSAITESYYRCVSIHGTNGTVLSNNVAYDIVGHCFYLEDGVEENNTIEFNFGSFIHFLGDLPIVDPNAFYSQQLDWVYQSTTSLLIPSDVTASVYYITNAFNTFRGNAASGGWTGFAFPTYLKPTGLNENVPINPSIRPNKLFDGNSAHSSGFWWSHGGAVYIGGQFEKSVADGVFRYNPGRSEAHHTCSKPLESWGGCDLGNQLWMTFTNLKTFLANKGVMHWGERSEFLNVEAHDTNIAVNVFGKVWIDKMLSDCRSTNKVTFVNGCPAPVSKWGTFQWWMCHPRDIYHWYDYVGVQWYDVGQMHIVTNSTFRNCTATMCLDSNSCYTGRAWTLLTHSDQFVPQVMQATANISYVNTNLTQLWKFSRDETYTTSGRLQNWRDTDGTASVNPAGNTVLGSTWGNEWWNVANSSCKRLLSGMNMFGCSVGNTDLSIGSIVLEADSAETDTVGVTQCGNGNGLPCPPIAYATHINRNLNLRQTGLNVTANSRITGPIASSLGGGWYVRYLQGTPKSLLVQSIQLESQNKTLILAIPYPAYTNFSVIANAPFCWSTKLRICNWSFTRESSLSSLYKRASGDGFYWDNVKNVLYVQVIQQWDGSLGENGKWDRSRPLQESFTRAGITLPGTRYATITINSNCTGSVENPKYCSLDNSDFDIVRSAIV